jgi:catechol 2,3-dioxygenase-like lactoylglutathione lyase family enzyme
MKRFHVHVAVPDLAQSIRFYSTLFGAAPSVVKDDYAKWMLEEPRVNFAISRRGEDSGINHLGFQVDSDVELGEIQGRLQAAGTGGVEEKNVSCCYARSDKYWTTDPSGIAWESFRSLGTVPLYHGEAKETACGSGESTCCAAQPETKEQPAKAGTSACCSAD